MSVTAITEDRPDLPRTVRRLVLEVLADSSGAVHPEEVASRVARRIVAEGWAIRALAEMLPNHVRWIMSRQRTSTGPSAPPVRADGQVHSPRRDLCLPARGWRARLSDLWAVGDGRYVPLGQLTAADLDYVIEDHVQRERALATQREMLAEFRAAVAEHGRPLGQLPPQVLRDLGVRP